MLWSMILFFSLFAAFNSLVDSAQSNYIKKIVIEYNGHKYINPYAFSDMNFTLETLDDKDFYFIVRKADPNVIPIKMSLSTDSPYTNVECSANRNTMKCRTSSHDTVQYVSQFKDQKIHLYGGYDDNGLNFSKDGLKHLLKTSSTFTPIDNENLCPFLMEWPTSVNLQESQEQAPQAVIPSNFDVCEEFESCEPLQNETGVKFVSKGTVEFIMALMDISKEYKLLHSYGYFSPIYTIAGSTSCTKYTTTIKFNDGSLTFKRDGEQMDIETDFKPLQESLNDVPISNTSNVNFYFYGNTVYCTFFDPQNAFQVRLFKLPKEIAESMKSETTVKIGHSSSFNECNETLKLLVGNGVKLLFPKSITSMTTVEPVNTITAANVTRNATTLKAGGKTEEASFPLWAIILISCIAGFLLIFGLVFAIYCFIKKRKNKSPKMTEISEVERRMLAKKPKKNQNDEINKNDEIGLEKKAAKKAPKKDEKKGGKKVEKKAGKKVENKATEAIPPPPELPSAKERTQSARRKLEKILERFEVPNVEVKENVIENGQQNEQENGQQNVHEHVEEDGRETTDDGQPPLTAIAKTKSVSKTRTEGEVGGTQTTQNSIPASQSITPEDSILPRKQMILKSKTQTKTGENGTAPTQFSITAEKS